MELVQSSNMGNSGTTNKKRKERHREMRAKDPRKLFKKTAAYYKGPKKPGPNSPVYGVTPTTVPSTPNPLYGSGQTTTPDTHHIYAGVSEVNRPASSPTPSSSTPSLDLLLVQKMGTSTNACVLVGSHGIADYVTRKIPGINKPEEIVLGTRVAIYFSTVDGALPLEKLLEVPQERVEITRDPAQAWGFHPELLKYGVKTVAAYVEKKLGTKPLLR